MPGADTHELDVHSYPLLTFLQGGELPAVAHPEGIALGDTRSEEEVAYVGAELPDFAATPVPSPDGCRFGYTPADGGAYVFDLRTGEPTVHAEGLALSAPVFSPDGRSLAAGGLAGDGVYEIDLETDGITTVGTEDGHWIDYSPSGDHLAVIGSSSVTVVNTRCGERVFVDEEVEAPVLANSVVLPDDEGELLHIGVEGIVRANHLTGSEPRVVASHEENPLGFDEVAAPPGADRFYALVSAFDDVGHNPELTAWEYSTGERLPTEGGARNARGMVVHPTGEFVAALSPDGYSVWLLDPGTLDVVTEFG